MVPSFLSSFFLPTNHPKKKQSMLTFSPIRAMDSQSKPQSARLFRLKPFQNKIQLVEQSAEPAPATDAPEKDALSKIRMGAVRLYETVRYVARDGLLGGQQAKHAWFWLLMFFVLAVTVMVLCFRLYAQVQAVEKRFAILVSLLQDARNIPGTFM